MNELKCLIADVTYDLEDGSGVLEMQTGSWRMLLDLGFVPGFSSDGLPARSVLKYG